MKFEQGENVLLQHQNIHAALDKLEEGACSWLAVNKHEET